MKRLMTSHTPGPWENDDGSIEAAVGCAVAQVYQAGDFPCLQRQDYEATEGECAANARLIAAAPDLLAALKRLLHETDDGTQLCGHNIVDDAKAAIAKAEGE